MVKVKSIKFDFRLIWNPYYRMMSAYRHNRVIQGTCGGIYNYFKQLLGVYKRKSRSIEINLPLFLELQRPEELLVKSIVETINHEYLHATIHWANDYVWDQSLRSKEGEEKVVSNLHDGNRVI